MKKKVGVIIMLISLSILNINADQTIYVRSGGTNLSFDRGNGFSGFGALRSTGSGSISIDITDIAISNISSIQYKTKSPSNNDGFIIELIGQRFNTFDDKLTGEPQYINSGSLPSDTWNLIQTGSGTNELRFHDPIRQSDPIQGGPTLSQIKSQTIVWANYGGSPANIDYVASGATIKQINLRATSANFELDDLVIVTNAETITYKFEPPIIAPTVNSQNVSLNENSNEQITLTGSDENLGTTLSFVIIQNPSNGSVSNFNSQTGTFTYTPNQNYDGSDEVKFKVNNGSFDSNEATVSITVNSVNDPPLVGSNITTAALPSQTIDISLTGSDPDGDTISYQIESNPTGGQIINFNPANGQLQYVANQDFTGNDTFTWKVKDPSNLLSNVGTVTVIVLPGNFNPTNTPTPSNTSLPPTSTPTFTNTPLPPPPPTFTNTPIPGPPIISSNNKILYEITVNTFSTVFGMLALDNDSPLTYKILSIEPSSSGTLNATEKVVHGHAFANFIFSPKKGFTGEIKITWQAKDPGGLPSEIGSLIINIIDPNASPTPTRVATSTPTPSHTPTLTDTPTETQTPTSTETPEFTATPVFTPTFTLTPTPTNTNTPVPGNSQPEVLKYNVSNALIGLEKKISLFIKDIESNPITVEVGEGATLLSLSPIGNTTLVSLILDTSSVGKKEVTVTISDGASSPVVEVIKYEVVSSIPTPTPTFTQTRTPTITNTPIATTTATPTPTPVINLSTTGNNDVRVSWDWGHLEVDSFTVRLEINGKNNFQEKTNLSADLRNITFLVSTNGFFNVIVKGVDKNGNLIKEFNSGLTPLNPLNTPLPTPTNTLKPTATRTSTSTPTLTATPTIMAVTVEVEADKLVVTDNLFSSQNLIGFIDEDINEERELVIWWNLDQIIQTFGLVSDVHIYNGTNYISRTGGEKEFFKWNSNAPLLGEFGQGGPRFDTPYQFTVFFLLAGFEKDHSRLHTIVANGIVELKEITTQIPLTPTPTIIISPTPSPSPTASPTITPTPTPIPNRVWVTDDLTKTADLSGGTDTDIANNKSLVVRWTLNTKEVISYHIYVKENGGARQFIKAVSNNVNLFSWTEPSFNSSYVFEVFAVQNGHSAESPRFEGPFENAGPILYLEFTG